MKRRQFLKGAAISGAAAAAVGSFPTPAISQGRMEWRMVTSWPKGMGGVQTGAERLAARIGQMSEGKLTIKVFAGGELVPALQGFDAVSQGTAEMCHDASYYHIGKNAGCQFFTCVPFGFTASEITAWIHYGGGQEVWDELYAQYNLKGFIAGNTGTQALGWYRKEMKTAADYKGLKVRMPGWGGAIVARLGAQQVVVPGGEIFAALQSGAIDAGEWIGPYNDLAMGFHQVAKLCYGPGFHEPGSALQLMVNKQRFDGLSADLKEVIKVAAQASHDDMLAEYNMRSAEAMETLRSRHGVRFMVAPDALMQEFAKAAASYIAEQRQKADATTQKIFTSYDRARRQLTTYNRFLEGAFVRARAQVERAFG